MKSSMKFDKHNDWKHKNCLDVFFRVRKVAFDDDGKNAILHGCWMCQGVEKYWFIVPDRIKIEPDQYDNWIEYQPKGQLTL